MIKEKSSFAEKALIVEFLERKKHDLHNPITYRY